MEFLSKKQKIILIILAIIIIIFIGYYIIQKTENYNYIELETQEESDSDTNNSQAEEEITDEEIVVHITGEVENTGIIKINKDARLADVIDKAGGATVYADLSKVNLAYSVQDGQKIYIPSIDDQNVNEEYITEEAGENVIQEDEKLNEEKVNINTAKQTELETLNGIGPSTALKIINYRNENGKFNTIEDIKNVPGIGEAKYDNIKNNICV